MAENKELSGEKSFGLDYKSFGKSFTYIKNGFYEIHRPTDYRPLTHRPTNPPTPTHRLTDLILTDPTEKILLKRLDNREISILQSTNTVAKC